MTAESLKSRVASVEMHATGHASTELPPAIAGHRRWLLVVLVVNGAVQAFAATTAALLIRLTFDRAFSWSETLTVIAALGVGGALLATALALAWLRGRERVHAECLGRDFARDLRLHIRDRTNRLHARVLPPEGPNRLLLRCVGDLTVLRRWISLGFARLVVAATTVGVACIALAMINLPIATVVGLTLACGAGVMLARGDRPRAAGLRVPAGGSQGKPMQPQGDASLAFARASAAARLQAPVSTRGAGLGDLGQSGQVRRPCGRRRRDIRGGPGAVEGARALDELTAAIATGAALLLGAAGLAGQGATPGTVVAAMSIVALLLPALRDLDRVYASWGDARRARERLRDCLAIPALHLTGDEVFPLEAKRGCVDLCDLSVAGALDSLTEEIPVDAVTAVVGPPGAGKSTLLLAVARLVRPAGGRVLIDGQDLATVTRKSLRRSVGIVSPGLPLLRGSIAKNLRHRWPDATERALESVSRLCRIDELASELPRGMDTQLGDSGANLSPGQRQRIALARALLGWPRVLLIDELDAYLDSALWPGLEAHLARHRGTVLVTTRRRNVVLKCDFVLHLDAGALIESGRPQMLFATDSQTARLFQRGPKQANPGSRRVEEPTGQCLPEMTGRGWLWTVSRRSRRSAARKQP